MRNRQAILISLIATFALSSCAFAMVWVPADKYLAIRRQTKALVGQSAANASVDPALSQSQVFEIKGTVCGVARLGDSSTFIVNGSDFSYVIKSSDPDPQIEAGSKVRMLVKSPGGASDLQLVSAAWDNDISQREQAEVVKMQRKQAAPTAKPSRSATPSRHRDVLSSRSLDILEPYKKAIAKFNRKLSARQVDTIARSILAYSEAYDVDPRLVVAVVLAESHFKIGATSRAGAMGLGQLMPGTAAGLGVYDAYDPQQNLAGSVRLIRGHLDKLSGGKKWSDLNWEHLALALASYNAGPGAVRKYGGVPPYRETRTYIARVMSIYKQLCGIG